MSRDPITDLHQEWLGYAKPVGLVVSIAALKAASAVIDRSSLARLHGQFLALLPKDRDDEPVPFLPGFAALATHLLEWPADLLIADPPVIAETPELPRPSFALQDYETPGKWLLLVQEFTDAHLDLDAESKENPKSPQLSPQARFERLLRESKVPIGLLATPSALRLVYAPSGESSGHVTFRAVDLVLTAGRPLLGALHLLLSASRLFGGDPKERLPALLSSSRRFQNQVSTKLADQVLSALYELLRGFEAARDQPGGEPLRLALASDPDQVYSGLLTVLMRLVFLLYAEDRNLLPADSLYQNNYSVGGLFEQLREDQAHYPDTVDSRYGAWARLVALFRVLYEGANHGDEKASQPNLHIPARRGYLFDPERYPFLLGHGGNFPRVADGTLYRVLEKLLVLDGERLSYRTLDVEQIGSVYEVTMGFGLQVAKGLSIAIRSPKRHGAPVTVNLEELLAIKPADRSKWLGTATGQSLTGKAADALKAAATPGDLLAALDRKIARSVTPNPVPAGAMVFQPSLERRHSGSNYTPRSLTSPIVEHTLAPVLLALGPNPTPDQILALKVCDPAMGSGAFLVEACRQLGATLARSWQAHDETPGLSPDEDILLAAQRIVAQRCLYGVDRNHMAADLAKLSLWLATFAKDHPFTFLDHAMRDGDSLVGFGVTEISRFSWESADQANIFGDRMRSDLDLALRNRAFIANAPDSMPYENRRQKLDWVEDKLKDAHLAGDALVAAFFTDPKPAARKKARNALAVALKRNSGLVSDLEALATLEAAVRGLRAKGVRPFHWELEFPEVFRQGGFDAMVGNPPFAGKNTLLNGNPAGYLDWLQLVHPESHGNSDLVAHFFRRSFSLLKPNGCFGLIATNTIGQGDTRSTGLRWICQNGGTIYRAKKRLKWPGEAAVVVSVVHIVKGKYNGDLILDDRSVPLITAYLFHEGGHEDPVRMVENADKSFQGSIILGMGFTFDDTDKKGKASPLSEMHRLIAEDPRNQERIFPYLGGEEINDSPTHSHHRFVINFEGFTLEKARSWPKLLEIVELRVRPERAKISDEFGQKYWWQFLRQRQELNLAKNDYSQIIALCRHSPYLGLAFVPISPVLADSTVAITYSTSPPFTILQSRVHEVWARFMASSMKDDLRYTPSDCFETFPFPLDYETSTTLAEVGETYYNFRAALMVQTNLGLTKTYNRFHNPEESDPAILKLRALHAAMDQAVLAAYQWDDLAVPCEFFPEHDDQDDEDDDPPGKPKKKRFRLRWPDLIRDQLLARLLLLNAERARQQQTNASPPGATKSHAPRPSPHQEFPFE